MKRLIVLYLLIIIATTSSSGCCRRGWGLWGLRGAPCGAPMAPTYTPVPAYAPPAYAPPAYPCTPTIQEVPCDPCSIYGGSAVTGSPVISSGSMYDGGVIYGGSSAADIPPTISTPIPTVPMESGRLPKAPLSNTALLGVPIFSHVVGDRKLAPGETLGAETPATVESAAARESSETK